MDFSNIPKKIDTDVISFCKTINPNSSPEFVQLKPESWCEMNECYNNVKRKVKECGGKRQLGWRIQIIPDPLPKYMMEAVHHAIWISDSGEKVDITPLPVSTNQIVFIEDEITVYDKYRIGEKYYALIDCPLVKEYVRLCNLESTEYVSKTKINDHPDIPKELIVKQGILTEQIFRKHGVLNKILQSLGNNFNKN